jgi:hypothetical protein
LFYLRISIPPMPTQSEILPYFKRLLMALQRAVTRLLRRSPSADVLGLQANLMVQAELYQRGQITATELAKRLANYLPEATDERYALLEELALELEVNSLEKEAEAFRAVLEAEKA